MSHSCRLFLWVEKNRLCGRVTIDESCSWCWTMMSSSISWLRQLRIDCIQDSLVEYVFVVAWWIFVNYKKVQSSLRINFRSSNYCINRLLLLVFLIPLEADDGWYVLQNLIIGFWRNIRFQHLCLVNNMMSIGVTQWVTVVGCSYGVYKINSVEELL